MTERLISLDPPPASKPLRVGVVGLGTIGKRVVEAIVSQPDMEVAGLAARRPSAYLHAVSGNHALFSTGTPFVVSGRTVDGSLSDLVAAADVIADCGPRGTAVERIRLYRDKVTPFVLQGGEASDTAAQSFCAAVKTGAAYGAESLRVVSCNTVGLTRFIAALMRVGEIETVRMVLMRCAADPDKAGKGNPFGLTSEPGYSHHADDIRIFWPDLDIASIGLKVPSNRGHMVSGFVRFGTSVELDAIRNALGTARRVRVVPGPMDTMRIRSEFGSGRRKDCFDLLVWQEGLSLRGRELAFTLAVHMEAIVIPDTIDALRRLTRPGIAAARSLDMTDQALGSAPRVSIAEDVLSC